MAKSCIICSAVASPDLQLQYCAQCQSALYCSKACQREDWKKRHKKICKLLNVGHGDMQVRNDLHESRCIDRKASFENKERNLDEDVKRFLKLFTESTFDGSQAAAQKMKKFAKRQPAQNQQFLLYFSLHFLTRSSSSYSEMLSWTNSPFLVMLQLVDPNMPVGEDHFTPLHALANVADPFDYSTHENQLVLAKQLIEQGANVNAVSVGNGRTPLQEACHAGRVTNLDFVELLLEKGADPNTRDHKGLTPLMYTLNAAPGAVKVLLDWPTTDVNILCRSGESFLAMVRRAITFFSSGLLSLITLRGSNTNSSLSSGV
jgi:hypothetical protein